MSEKMAKLICFHNMPACSEGSDFFFKLQPKDMQGRFL